MTLTDDIAAAEQLARSACQRVWEQQAQAKSGRYADTDAALNRYAAVCRLAGWWEALPGQQAEDRIRADLARLMEGCP